MKKSLTTSSIVLMLGLGALLGPTPGSVLTGSWGAGHASAQTAAAAPSTESFANAYLAAVEQAAKKTRGDMAAISKAADEAATLYIAGKSFGVRGGMGLNDELGARAGGMCVYRAGKGEPGDVILYAFSTTATKDAADPKAAILKLIADAADLKSKGSYVVGLASFKQLESLGLKDQAQAACSVFFDNYGPATDAFYLPGAPDQPAVTTPIYTSLNPIFAWTFVAEFFAACTRQGKVPAHYQSIVDDPKRERYDKYVKVKFHDDMKVPSIPAGQLGGAYLDSFDGSLKAIAKSEIPKILQVGKSAGEVIKSGGKIHLFSNGHYPPYHANGQLAGDPRVTVWVTMPPKPKMNPDGTPAKPPAKPPVVSPEPTAADLSIAIGYSLPPGDSPFWKESVPKLRMSGKGVVWVIATFLTKPEDLRPGEVVIDQHWGKGDAVVDVPGYDVKICPTSGIISEALMWMLIGQAVQDSKR